MRMKHQKDYSFFECHFKVHDPKAMQQIQTEIQENFMLYTLCISRHRKQHFLIIVIISSSGKVETISIKVIIVEKIIDNNAYDNSPKLKLHFYYKTPSHD